jgi:very-short-patch-repair endonuclease
MTKLYIILGIIFAIVIASSFVKEVFDGKSEEKNEYKYKRKNFFLTRAEHECFDALIEAVGSEYLIFAQVHLASLLDNKVIGQNWRGAFKHINQKSVDFVLCDKNYISPKLAIELDDRTHERPDRQERDREVERILKDAGLPLLRLENNGKFDQNELAIKIRSAVSN